MIYPFDRNIVFAFLIVVLVTTTGCSGLLGLISDPVEEFSQLINSTCTTWAEKCLAGKISDADSFCKQALNKTPIEPFVNRPKKLDYWGFESCLRAGNDCEILNTQDAEQKVGKCISQTIDGMNTTVPLKNKFIHTVKNFGVILIFGYIQIPLLALTFFLGGLGRRSFMKRSLISWGIGIFGTMIYLVVCFNPLNSYLLLRTFKGTWYGATVATDLVVFAILYVVPLLLITVRRRSEPTPKSRSWPLLGLGVLLLIPSIAGLSFVLLIVFRFVKYGPMVP